MVESPPALDEQPGALFELYGPALYRFACVLLHDGADAEDVVQTAFVRLMEHLARDGDRTHLRAWLFTVTANLARDRLRARRRWVPWELSPAARLTTAPELDLRDPQQQFLHATRQLAPRDRLLLALRAQGLSYREIADASGVKLSSVGQLLARALARWQRVRESTAIT